MNRKMLRTWLLVFAVGVLFLVILACSQGQQAPVQTAAAAVAQTALAEGKKAAGTEAAHLLETGQVAGKTAAAHLLETGQAAGGTAAVAAAQTVNAMVATEAAQALETLTGGLAPQFQQPVSGAGISIGPWGPGDGDHNGPDLYAIDFLGPEGTPIHPTLAGEVVFSGQVTDGYGYALAIRHSQDQLLGKYYYSIYTHLMNRDLPAVGTQVGLDTVIGYLGTTGTTEVHLHFAVRVSDKSYSGAQALYGQSRQTSPPTIYTPAYNVRARFGLNP
jgi:murein DD-endopeptidase MepM/ murein hydrolase activator NlpD